MTEVEAASGVNTLISLLDDKVGTGDPGGERPSCLDLRDSVEDRGDGGMGKGAFVLSVAKS